jgi:hypothetical protein
MAARASGEVYRLRASAESAPSPAAMAAANPIASQSP